MTQSNDVIAIVVVVLTVVLLVGGYVTWRWRRAVLLRRSVQYDSESSGSSLPAVIIEDEHVLRVPERVVVSERRRVRQVSGYHGVGRPGMQEAPPFRRPFVVDANPGSRKHRGFISEYRDFISKYRDFISKHRDFIGKHRDFISKHRDFIGKYRDFIGKHRDFIGKYRDFIGKHRDFIGKHRDFIGKHRDFIGKHRDFIGKYRDFIDNQPQMWRWRRKQPHVSVEAQGRRATEPKQVAVGHFHLPS
ncbi:hypothetical protein B0T26DRAFT_805707 [Lasiosphaeria miniovina]|uniref:Uncharacterized protein n=1 Tax=Lasiosphaeria miniovina TaxID=1954250 RepID=A0AA40A6N9_9PEZI|nr:uncharacterized protein B0T26DRAFT_805707 [Lasiosphaeria miniovina]KAK0710217.1 hypothetical protein B0T26DRAFT_805707 [Lasiosphaeria miniovina]